LKIHGYVGPEKCNPITLTNNGRYNNNNYIKTTHKGCFIFFAFPLLRKNGKNVKIDRFWVEHVVLVAGFTMVTGNWLRVACVRVRV